MDNIITIISITITAIISLFSIAISLITIKINNKHQIRLKVYDKKCDTYKSFFELYADYLYTKMYDKSQTMSVIINCLLVSNKNTTHFLTVLLKYLNGDNLFIDKQPTEQNYFTNCIESMKEELSLN